MKKSYALVTSQDRDAFERELDSLGKAGWDFVAFATTGTFTWTTSTTPVQSGSGVMYSAIMAADVDNDERPRVEGGKRKAVDVITAPPTTR